MRKCTGNNMREWGFDAIFDVECPHCGAMVEFFQDEITRDCPQCRETVKSDRTDFGCGLWCSADSPQRRNMCPKFKRAKVRFYGTSTPSVMY